MNKEEQLQQDLQALGIDQPQEQEEQEQEEPEGKWETIKEPEQTVPLFMVDFEHCDSKKCTGKKLERFKLLTKVKDMKKKFRGIVLSAFASKYVTKNDMEYIQKGGICVIDCSWNRIEETKEFRYKHERKLPFVVAGNPVNFGKPYQLSCAEALATALCTVGYLPQAKYIMSKFGWSEGFWKENSYLDLYSHCSTAKEIEAQSKENQENRSSGFQREYVYPSDSDEEELKPATLKQEEECLERQEEECLERQEEEQPE